MRVRWAALPVLVWCLATAASIAVATLALRPVLRTAVPSDSVPVETRGHRELIAQPPVPGSIIATAPSPAGSGTPGPTAPGTAPRTSTAPPTPTSKPITGVTGAAARIVDGWTVTTGSDGVDTYLKSFRSDGGDAVIRIRAAVVSLVTASPRSGYSASVAQSEPTRLVVQFVSTSGSSAYLVDCLWWQDAPHGEVTRIGT